ncbi:hypothetical protein ABT095_01960 [Kitasatospora sp. NPDC002227]|uniref:hypothetical protein n=1 Tax=Kitasatospora sp. NPDC002227 TaxID=3154773 RepID=UPI0033269BF9
MRSGAVGRRLAQGLLAAALASPLLVLAPATTASADPGFCGVRVDGPEPVSHGDAPYFAYLVRNKCSSAHRFQVYFPQLGRSTFCESVDPYGTYTYIYAYDTNSWEIRSC